MSTELTPLEENKEPSPYIRTFAKDFAALAAKNPGAVQDSKFKPKAPKLSKKPAAPVQQVVSKPDALESEIDSRAAEMQKEGNAILEAQTVEPISLPKIETGDIVRAEESAHPTPLEPVTSMMPQISEPSEPTTEERAAILERLKARVANHTAPAMPAQPPAPASPPETLPTLPTPTTGTQQETSSPIHTYTSDFADQIDEKHANAFSVLAAEKDAPIKSVQPSRKNHNGALAVVAGVVLLLAGVGGVFAAYVYMNKNAPILITATPTSLIVPDSRVKLTGVGPVLMRALAAKAGEPLPQNNVLLTYVDAATTTAQGVVEKQASGGAFITALNLPAPNILLRNIDPSSMVGIVHSETQTRPFFIFHVTSYERTFAGMLAWEPSLLQNLHILYPLYPAEVSPTPVPVSVSTTTSKTASTTTARIFAPAVNPTAPAAQFVDEVVINHSVRALKDTAGRTLVLYGYADKQTLIIARNEAAFTLLLSRLTATGS